MNDLKNYFETTQLDKQNLATQSEPLSNVLVVAWNKYEINILGVYKLKKTGKAFCLEKICLPNLLPFFYSRKKTH